MMRRGWSMGALVILGGAIGTGTAPRAFSQASGGQEVLAAVKDDAALNKMALANYTWQEQQTISIKGEVKSVQLYNVKLGPDGKPVRTPVDSQAAAEKHHEHGIKGHIVDKKEGEYKDYAEQIKALAQSYMHPDAAHLQQLYQQGQIMVAPGTNQLVIHNYQKQGDQVTFTLDPSGQRLGSIHVASYLSKPSDAVTITADFAPLTNGPNHVSSMVVNGESKQLTLQVQNSNYQNLGSSSS